MDNLIKKAKELLENNLVQVVIGYEKGNTQKSRPVFIFKAENADKLIYDESCHYNLASYITRQEMRHTGKMAVVANIHALKAMLVLANEHQFIEGNVIALAVDGSSDVTELKTFSEIEEYIASHPVELKEKEKVLLEKIKALSKEERWEFWQNELARCFKCYACRAACPMCYCHQCTVDCNKPQWITVAPHQLGNYEWQMMRAMHLAGRCVDCGACAEACPLDIPINMLTYYLSESIESNFGFKTGTSATKLYVLSDYKLEDKENFIR